MATGRAPGDPADAAVASGGQLAPMNRVIRWLDSRPLRDAFNGFAYARLENYLMICVVVIPLRSKWAHGVLLVVTEEARTAAPKETRSLLGREINRIRNRLFNLTQGG